MTGLSKRFTHAFRGSLKSDIVEKVYSCIQGSLKSEHQGCAQLLRRRAGYEFMEIIREGLSTSRLLVLDGKNYLYWKPRMIFFIKTLDGRTWRTLVARYEPPMITVDGVSVPKSEVDWTDAEEQASLGNARALNAIFNGVDLMCSNL
ncbi:gag-pol polyprotein [Cucumis melo var. makuwa]|uniref:Gag-pol polyprotein n=1 Tax=Cucumis melo var. makuwa TaxID=1194695 RepID=A0A5A7V284_CUCMM|nr:gag-pol polyprotein [Cucumis melo var. makuwa]TYK14735.1 gag-pol polyprotein [Cucumis melo var. makuwa]